MAQFDVFENPNRKVRSTLPYVVALQNDFSIGRETVIVAPIAPRGRADFNDRGVLPVTFNDKDFVVLMQGLASFPQRLLGKPVARLTDLKDRIPAAIDYLFLGM